MTSTHKVLTGEGGRFALQPEQRDMMCLMSDGTLFVSSSHGMNHHVLGFIERLNRNKFPFNRVEVPLTRLREIYKDDAHKHRPGVAGENDDNFKQREVVGLMKECVKLGVSDLHFRVNPDTTIIKVRIDGKLVKYKEYTGQHGKELCATIYQSMCDVADPTYRPEASQDGRMKKEFLQPVGLFGARIATRPTERGFLFVLRLLYGSKKESTLLDLGYLDEQIAIVKRMTERTTGINIFSGPTGSGKSTTLQCLLTMLLREYKNEIHLLTLEDPPEYEIEDAVHTPILYDKKDPESASREWANAISNSMRLDPDVMMVGEMRNLESAVASFRAAMTGHGLWTTLHANDMTSILSRLQDIGVEMSLLTDASLVTGLINQSLAPLLCPHCKIPFHKGKDSLEEDLLDRIEKYCKVDQVFLKGSGCNHCNDGIKGRSVIAEVCMPTQQFMTVFQTQGKAAARSYWVKSMNGITKNAHLLRRINEGLIDPFLGERRVCSLDFDEITLV